MSDQQYDFGLVGLGVMGRNFILNVADHGFSAYGLDTSQEMLDRLRAEGKGKSVDGTTEVTEFVSRLSSPRKIMLLVPAEQSHGRRELVRLLVTALWVIMRHLSRLHVLAATS